LQRLFWEQLFLRLFLQLPFFLNLIVSKYEIKILTFSYSPKKMAFFLCSGLGRNNRNKALVVLSLPKFNQTIGQCKQGKVPTHAYIFTGMINGATLTNDDVA
jgi:hypothetical protein